MLGGFCYAVAIVSLPLRYWWRNADPPLRYWWRDDSFTVLLRGCPSAVCKGRLRLVFSPTDSFGGVCVAIQSFADKETQKVYWNRFSKKIDHSIQTVA